MSAIVFTPPTHLYKYMAGVRIKDLLQNRIRFTQASAQDDPFELRPRFDIACTSEDLLEEVVRETSVEQLFERQYVQLGAAERTALPPLPVLMAFIRQMGSKHLIEPITALMRPIVAEMLARVRSQIERVLSGRVGILSLTEGPLSIRMWSHYADGHRGAAIEFDTSHPWFHRQRSDADEFFRLQKVHYLDLRSKGRTFLQIADENLLLTKSADWIDQREWRMLAPLPETDNTDQANEAVHLFELGPSAIAAVIVGARAGSSFIQESAERIQAEPSWRHVRLRRILVGERYSGINEPGYGVAGVTHGRGQLAIPTRHCSKRN